MSGWDQVRWTEARQIAALTGADEDELPEAGIEPRAHWQARRQAGALEEAVGFLGHALPRFEALAWAGRILEEEARDRTLRPRDRQALDYALRWVGDPNDDRRRAAMEAADEASERSPERLLAMAVFFSGGSISQPDLPPILPPPEAAGRLAANAIALAAHRSGDAPGVFARALDMGDRVATGGARALEAQ